MHTHTHTFATDPERFWGSTDILVLVSTSGAPLVTYRAENIGTLLKNNS